MRPFATCIAGLLIVGCTGERVESVTDSGTTDALAETFDAGCETVAGNLVQNPSFELAPSGVLSGWKADAKGGVVQRKGDAPHCNAWAEVQIPAASTSAASYFGQDIALDEPAPKGSHVVATMWLRTLDAELSGTFEIGEVSGPDTAKAVTLSADGKWKQVTLEWTLPEDVSSFWIAFVSTASVARRVGVDHATLVVTPP